MVSSAYTEIFSFSNADNILQGRVLHIFCYHDLSLCLLYKTQSKIIFYSSLLAPFVDSYYSPRGPHGRRLADFITVSSPDFGLAMVILSLLRLAKLP